MSKYSVFLGLLLTSLACKSQENDTKGFVAENCAQHPIDFYFHEQDRGGKLYLFGSQDAKFREFLENLQIAYATNGADIKGTRKVSIVSHYLPNYMSNCQKFFAPLVAECSQYPRKSQAFSSCIAPHNRKFERSLRGSLSRAGKSHIDLEKLSLSSSGPLELNDESQE